MLPMAYVYPAEMRATRDLLRRRNHLMRKRSELLVHIQNTNSQYCLPEFGKKIAYKKNREGVAERFTDPSVCKSVEMDLALIDHYDKLLGEVELYITKTAKVHDTQVFYRLRSVPGIGKILALVILYEIHDIHRFPTVGDFVSYSRLVKCSKESAGKRLGSSGAKTCSELIELSATSISSGPSPKPQSYSCARMPRPKGISTSSPPSTARPKPCRS